MENYCAHCGKHFNPKRPWHRFCKNSCRSMGHRARKDSRKRVTHALKMMEENARKHREEMDIKAKENSAFMAAMKTPIPNPFIMRVDFIQPGKPKLTLK